MTDINLKKEMIMKKIALSISALLLFTTAAFAAGPSGVRSNCGCGLGYILFKDSKNPGILIQIFAATTNGTFGNQTFGISSGTLGCGQPSSFAKADQMNKFVADNMDNLAVDIAAGKGETLDALAEIAEIAPAKRPQLYSALQKNFDKIYFQDDVNSLTVVTDVNGIIEKN